MNNTAGGNSETAYEWRTVLAVGLGFGFVVGFHQRLATLAQSVAMDVGLSPSDLMHLPKLFVIWGVFAIIAGPLSDKVGHRRVLIPAIALFSLLLGLAGMVQGWFMLAAVVALMGAMTGCFFAPGLAAVATASNPLRRGCNLGLQQGFARLLGVVIGLGAAFLPLFASAAMRSAFWAVAVPGFAIAALLFFTLREPQSSPVDGLVGAPSEGGRWIEVFGSRNTLIGVLALSLASALVTLSFFAIGASELSAAHTGVAFAVVAWGAVFGQFGWPALSDIVGRKLAAALGFCGAAATTFWLLDPGASLLHVVAAQFVFSYFVFGNIALITGPIAAESSRNGLISSTIGVVAGGAALLSGGATWIIGSYLPTAYGPLTVACAVLGVVLALALTETAPVKTRDAGGGTADRATPEKPGNGGKSVVVAYVFWLLFAGHRFYLGRVASGVVLLHLVLLVVFVEVATVLLSLGAFVDPELLAVGDQLRLLLGVPLALVAAIWWIADAFRIPGMARPDGGRSDQ